MIKSNRGGYVGIIKKLLTKQYHNQVTTYNYGKSGDLSDQILDRLQNQTAIQTNLKSADVIVMTVGGNDPYPKFCMRMHLVNRLIKSKQRSKKPGLTIVKNSTS